MRDCSRQRDWGSDCVIECLSGSEAPDPGRALFNPDTGNENIRRAVPLPPSQIS